MALVTRCRPGAPARAQRAVRRRRADLLAAETALVSRLDVCESLDAKAEGESDGELHVVHMCSLPLHARHHPVAGLAAPTTQKRPQVGVAALRRQLGHDAVALSTAEHGRDGALEVLDDVCARRRAEDRLRLQRHDRHLVLALLAGDVLAPGLDTQ